MPPFRVKVHYRWVKEADLSADAGQTVMMWLVIVAAIGIAIATCGDDGDGRSGEIHMRSGGGSSLAMAPSVPKWD